MNVYTLTVHDELSYARRAKVGGSRRCVMAVT